VAATAWADPVAVAAGAAPGGGPLAPWLKPALALALAAPAAASGLTLPSDGRGE
jgi:hypothetical protein